MLRQVFVPNRDLATTIDSSHPMTFYVDGASTIAIHYTAARTLLRVRINDSAVPYDVRTSGFGKFERTTVAWGLAGGITKVELSTTVGGIDVTNIVASQLPGERRPSSRSPAARYEAPLGGIWGLRS